jgi:hypothetical protein
MMTIQMIFYVRNVMLNAKLVLMALILVAPPVRFSI